MSECGPSAGLDVMTWTAHRLAGEPLPPLPARPGRVFVARDEPLAPEYLVGITSAVELSRLLGISRQAAGQRLKKAGNP